jgi:hypothetical protein
MKPRARVRTETLTFNDRRLERAPVKRLEQWAEGMRQSAKAIERISGGM